MGHYRVWAVTGENENIMELLEPYDEENGIPGEWPGLSFDYYEIERTEQPGILADMLHRGEGDLPFAMVSASGQITADQDREEGTSHGMPPLLAGGYQRMIQELAGSETGRVFVLDWHA